MILASNDNSFILVLIIIIFFIIPVIAFLIILRARRNTPEAKGKRGEDSVSEMLNKIASKQGGYIINDVILPNGKGTTQIDHIYFSSAGVVVIETKNYSGRVYGDETSTYWTQVLGYGNVKNKLYNPLKQNDAHVFAISKVLREDVEIVPFVVFVQGNVEHIKSEKVYSISQARYNIMSLTSRYTDNDAYRWYSKVKRYKDNPISSEEEHIERVRQKKNY